MPRKSISEKCSLSDALRKAEATSSDVERKTHAKEQLDRSVSATARVERESLERGELSAADLARGAAWGLAAGLKRQEMARAVDEAQKEDNLARSEPRKSGRCSPPRRPRPRSSRSTTTNGGRRAPRPKCSRRRRAPKKRIWRRPKEERRDEASLGLCRNRGNHRVRRCIGVHEPHVARRDRRSPRGR